MLKGLEATEVNFNKLLTGVETFRLDSEYHRKEYLEIEDYVSSHSGLFSKFSDYDVPIDCSAFYPGIEQLYGTGDIPIIRVQNVKGAIDYENCATLPSLMDPKYATLKTVSEGDIVITKGGTIGLAGYVTKTAYASRDLIIVKSSSLPEDTRIFLYLYLSTDFAYKQLIRSSSQCAQPHLTITLVKNFDLLKPINALEKRCSDLYKESQSKLDVSKSLYNKAEDILLKYLGVPSNINESNIFNVKTLSESFLNSGRLDPEYYQTKYDGLFSLLGKFKTKTLSSIADIKKSIEPGSDEYTETGIPFIRVADLSKYGLSRPSTFLDKDAYRSVIRPQKDTILLSKDGSVGIAFKVEEPLDVITSSAILHLTVIDEEILPDYLALVLNSIIVGMQAERDAGGSIIKHWLLSDINNVVIPILPKEKQLDIVNNMRRSFELRRESTYLSEKAVSLIAETIKNEGKIIDIGKIS